MYSDGRILHDRLSKIGFRKNQPEIAWDPELNNLKWLGCSEVDGAS